MKLFLELFLILVLFYLIKCKNKIEENFANLSDSIVLKNRYLNNTIQPKFKLF